MSRGHYSGSMNIIMSDNVSVIVNIGIHNRDILLSSILHTHSVIRAYLILIPYMLQEHVENGFIDTGEQVAPVSLFLESDKVETLVDFINETGLFYAEMQQINNIAQQGHILLNPIN